MANAIKPMKITFKKAEAEWRKYHQTLRDISSLREEIMNPFDNEPDQNSGEGKNSVRPISDPTATVTTRMLTNKQLNYLIEVAEAIEEVYNALPDDYKKLARMRYWRRGNELTWEGIAHRLHVSKRQAMRWRDEIIQATLEVLGWI
ncbi:transcriptional regulator [Amphibacillus sp. Q70]|uniref:transcriptional regulator n=1 Tax=Amphibacillus sp. Q70 TaxID=3453416 RepID=UPI003F856356